MYALLCEEACRSHLAARMQNLPRTTAGCCSVGDRFYTLARWLVLVLLFGTSSLLTNEPLWPPWGTTNAFVLLLWAYTLFSIVSTALLFFRPPSTVRSLVFLIDIIFITLLTLASRDNADLFYPLYLLPLIGAAIQMSSQAGLLIGIAAALCYVAAYLVPLLGPESERLPARCLGPRGTGVAGSNADLHPLAGGRPGRA